MILNLSQQAMQTEDDREAPRARFPSGEEKESMEIRERLESKWRRFSATKGASNHTIKNGKRKSSVHKIDDCKRTISGLKALYSTCFT